MSVALRREMMRQKRWTYPPEFKAKEAFRGVKCLCEEVGFNPGILKEALAK